MNSFINKFLTFGYFVYWIAWFGSMIFFDVSIFTGIIIGVISFIIHLFILQILYFINGDGWLFSSKLSSKQLNQIKKAFDNYGTQS